MKTQFHYNGCVYWVIFVYFSLKYCLKHSSSRFNTILKADVYQIIQSNWFCVQIIVQCVRGCVKKKAWIWPIYKGKSLLRRTYGLKPLWFNDDIKGARKTRDRYHKNKDDENYRFWRNKVTTLIKQAKTNYYESAVKENKTSGDIWRHIKELNPKQTTCTPEIIKTSDQVLENPEDIANEFNNYFVNICQTLGIVNKNNESTFSIKNKYVKSKLDSSKKLAL